jgi:hypothetical protein
MTKFALLARLLKADIDAIADVHETVGPDWPTHPSTTKDGVPFVTIVNGYLKSEGAPAAPQTDSRAMCMLSLTEVKALRPRGHVRLVWRIEPEFGEDGSLYMRLAFDRIGSVSEQTRKVFVVEA